MRQGAEQGGRGGGERREGGKSREGNGQEGRRGEGRGWSQVNKRASQERS